MRQWVLDVPQQSSGWLTDQATAGTVKAAAPVVVPLGALVLARILGASWPMAMVTACAVLPIVWYVTYQSNWSQQSA